MINTEISFRISGVGTFASALLTTLSAFQLMFLQDNVGYLGDVTGVIIVLIVVGGIGLAVSAPAFLNLECKSKILEYDNGKKIHVRITETQTRR